MITFNWYKFSELTVEQLYAVLALRSEVFVVEQHCSYLDPDGQDVFALHLLGTKQDSLVAYLRLFLPTDINNHIVFGRVVTAKSSRTKGYGKKLMQALLAYCDTKFPGMIIKCSAQHHLKHFYEAFGFQTEGEIYEEDEIQHIAMQRIF